MQVDERSNTALKSTYGCMQKYELRQAIQTGNISSKLTGRRKKINQLM